MILTALARNNQVDALNALINTGAGTATLVFETTADEAAATVNLQNPALAVASAGAAGVLGVPLQDTNAAGQASPVGQASIYNRDAAKVCEITVAVSGSEIDLDNLQIDATDILTLNSLQFAQPA